MVFSYYSRAFLYCTNLKRFFYFHDSCEGILNCNNKFLAATFTPFRFNAIVCQEFILLLIVLGLSMYFESFDIYITVIIAYIYHVIGHVIQSIFLQQYIPGVFSGIVTAGYCTYQIYDVVSANCMLLGYSFVTLLIIFVNIAVSFKMLQRIQKNV